MLDNEKIMNVALNEAKKSLKTKDVPVGAVIVYKNRIISKAHNNKNIKKCCINHAEINAIILANKKLKNERLDDCVLYVTMEPCQMCMSVIIESKIKKIVYGIKNKNNIHNLLLTNCEKVEMQNNVLKNDIEKMMKDFFEEIRNK